MQFEVAVSLNHDVMISFWLHKWARTPKSDPSKVGITVWDYYHIPMDSISMCSNTSYMSNMDAGSSLRWLSASTVTQWHHFDSTSEPEPQNLSQVVWYNCLRQLPYAHGKHTNLLKCFVYVSCQCEKQFEVAVSLNHDIMISFWLCKWARTPKSEPSSVGITVWGYCHIPMDSISMCSNTFDMSNMDAGSSLRWLSASTMT